jgi:predicted metallo-beta-lactamase superfamily hydrolase
LVDDESDTGWEVLKEYDLADVGDQYIPDQTDEFADNTRFEIDGDQIIDFSESNPFGEVGNTP